MAYETDPDVAAFLSVGKGSAASRIPTKEPTLEEIKKNKKGYSNANPQLQAEADYATDPDVSAFLSVTPKKVKTADLPNQFQQLVGKGLQTFQQPIQQMRDIGEAGAALLSGAVAAPLGAATGVVSALRSGKFGTQEGIKAGQEQAANLQQQLTYQPRSEGAKSIVESISKIPEKITGSTMGFGPLPETYGFAPLAVAGAGQAVAKTAAAPTQMRQQFQNLKAQAPTVRVEKVQPGMQSGGAAAAVPENVLRGNIDAAIANATPELQAHVSALPPQKVNIPALETRALEEKHGVNLTTGQRSGDTQLYSQEWNKRGESEALGSHFNEQPVQISNAFEVSKQRHAPDIPSTADASELGQIMIDSLAAKDQVRQDAIRGAYKALQDANGGQFPIDVQTLDASIKQNLASNLKTSHLSTAIASDLKDFYANPTFEAYEALRTNLSNEMRSSANGNARAAAYIVRQELENLPIFGAEGGSPQAIQLKALADQARSLHKERQDILKSNPAYRAAVREAGTLEEAAAQGESLNADKFHKKFVASASPEAIRRMKAELGADDIANQAISFSELDRAKNAAVNASGRNLTPEQFAKFFKQNKSILRETLSPEAMQDVTELGMLTSKIGMPKTGTFNYSNTYSGMLADMAKQGLLGAGEAKLATMTGGASIPAVSLTRQMFQRMNKEAFAREALNPYGGLTKD
jgi:hypothetical protein